MNVQEENNREERPKIKYDPKTYVCAFIMMIWFAVMLTLVFIVTHHPDLQNDEYKVSVWYIIQSFIFYFLCSLIWTRRRAFYLWRKLLPFRVSGLIGFFWSINYVCVLVAGPYLPNAIQTIFGQCQLVIVYGVNFWIFNNRLRWYHHTIIGSIITFNLATAWGGGFTSSQSGGILFLWCLIFMMNALAAGLANNLLEAFFVAARIDIKEPKVLMGNYSLQDYILAINAVAGLWSLVACIPLALIALLAYRENFINQVFFNWNSFTSIDGQLFIFGMGLSSWFFTILSYFVIAETTALWMTVASQVATITQLLFLAYINNPIYQSVPDITQWINNGILCAIQFIYAIEQPDKENTVHYILESRIGRHYKNALKKSFFSEDNEKIPLMT